MRLAFFGSSLVSAYWNGAATYYRGLLKALSHHGFQIEFYEPDAFDRQQHRDIDPPDWAKVVVWPATAEGMRAALDQARGADIVVKASGVGVFDAELEREILSIRNPGGRAIFWDVDAPATLASMQADPDDALRALVPQYDMVLTYGGGDPVVQAYKALGAKACVPVYNALEPDSHFPVTANPDFGCDLVFLGNRLPDREARVDEFFLKPAALLPQRRFFLGGNGWDGKPMPGNIRRLGHVYTHQHNMVNCSALAVLNINRDSMAKTGFSPPTRVFEAAGAGACIISDAWEGIEDFLEPGSEILIAKDGTDVAALLDGLDIDRSMAIGQAARRRVLSAHTYAHRAAQVTALLSGNASLAEVAQ